MSDETCAFFNACKIVEEENGTIRFLPENFQEFRTAISKHSHNIPVVFVSIVGTQSREKAFLTNLLYGFIKSNGIEWDGLPSEGFWFGFPYEEKNEKSASHFKVFSIDENRSGIYFWPELMQADHCNGSKLICLLYSHHINCQTDESISNSLLSKFLLTISSAIINMTPNITAGFLEEDLPALCNHIVHLRVLSCSNTVESVRLDDIVKMENVFPELKAGKQNPFSSKQLRKLEKVMKNTLEPHHLKPRKFQNGTINLTTMKDFIMCSVEFVNQKYQDTADLTSDIGGQLKSAQRLGNNKHLAKKKNELLKDKSPGQAPVQSKPTINPPHDNSGNTDQTKYAQKLAKTPQIKVQDKNVIGLETGIIYEKPERPSEISGDMANNDQFWQSLWPKLEIAFHGWMESQLRKDNINDMYAVFNSITETVLASENALMQKKDKKFQNREEFAPQKIESLYFEKFQEIQQAIKLYALAADALAAEGQNYSDSVLNEKLTSSLHSALALLRHSELTGIVTMGCNKLASCYITTNLKSRQDESNLLDKAEEKIEKFFQDELKNILQTDKYVHPENLFLVKNALISQLENVYHKAFSNTDEQKWKQIGSKLDATYSEIYKNNLRNIEAAQKAVAIQISKMKGEYESEMDTLLEDNPKGTPKDVFKVEHKRIETDILSKFETDVKALVHTYEDISIHIRTLQSSIDHSRKMIEEENNALLEENLSPAPSKPEHIPVLQTPSQQHQTFAYPEAQIFLNQLPPLLVHLTLNNIGIGILKNDSVDPNYTTAELAMTNSEEWVFGNEVQSYEPTSLKYRWHLGQCLSINYQQQRNSIHIFTEPIRYQNEDLDVTTEFLIALFLRHFKQKIENELNGSTSEVYISIPFWLPSFQRQQVKNAANLAGFTHSNLFNENTASAYFMFSSNTCSSKCNAIVLSECSGRLDISLYSYTNNVDKHTLTMLSHTGNYESNETTEYHWILRKVVLTGKRVINYIFGNPQQLGEEESAIKKLYALWQKTQSYAENKCSDHLHPDRKVLIFCESVAWEKILQKLGQKISKNVKVCRNSTVDGMASVWRHLQSEPCNIRDGIPFYVSIFSPSGKQENAFKKEDSFTFTELKIRKICKTYGLGNSHGTYLISQDNGSGAIPIGKVKLETSLPPNSNLEITLELSTEGIITVRKVEYTNSHKTFPSDCFTVEYCSSPFVNGVKYTRVIQDILHSGSYAGQLDRERETGIQKANVILSLIEQDRGSFPSDIVKSLATKEVTDALRFIKQNAKNKEEILGKIKLLNNISKTYSIN